MITKMDTQILLFIPMELLELSGDKEVGENNANSES